LRVTTLCVCAVLGLAAAALRAEPTITADQYRDKLAGMWLGQILGNYAGRPTEGYYSTAPRGNPATDISWDFITTDEQGQPRVRWVGDDDTVLEYMYAVLLAANPAPTNEQIRQTWQTYVRMPSLYIANKQARWLMATPTPDLTPPDTGSIHYNMHWYAIDAQIATEAVGSLTPHLRRRAADLTGQLAATTNDGYPVHAAQFYAAMYAAAALETTADAATIERIIDAALEVVPTTSRSYRIIADTIAFHAADKAAHQADPSDLIDWRDAREMLYNVYVHPDGANGRYRYWIESTINLGLTVMSLLYGEGDFTETVKIGVLAGFDCDCNPATAGGLIGLIAGRSGLPTELTDQATDAYRIGTLIVPDPDTTITDVATLLQVAAEQQILAAGGSITGVGAARTYHLPDAEAITPPAELPDPPGPTGLAADVPAAGGTVTPIASRAFYVANRDRQDLAAIIDGLTDLSYNGHLPYFSDDGTSGADEDWYGLAFDRKVTFTKVIFDEGDVTWSTINGNPADPGVIVGGYFTDLTVEVGRSGAFTEVAELQFSEPLEPLTYFQRIELTFLPAVGDTIRIRGHTGGTRRFTSIVELTAEGLAAAPTPGDADLDGDVDLDDFVLLKIHWGAAAGATWGEGDFNADGAINLDDFMILKSHFGVH